MILVSELKASEIDAYSNVLKNLIQKTMSFPDAAKNNYVEQWNSDFILSTLNRNIYLVGKIDNDIVGVLIGSGIEGGVGTIIWVLVDPEIQKKGIGSKLLVKAFELFKQKGAHKVKLTVPDQNTTFFYEKNGMKLEGFHPNHWWNHDFWSMAIEI